MPGLTLWTANHLERLAADLAGRIRRREEGDPFVPETVVIQSRGMERWLALEIARHNGIAANLKFPYPETFLQTMLETVLPGTPAEAALERGPLAFGIFALLPSMAAAAPEFAPIRAYLQSDANGVRRLQLAGQIAHLFDQYLVFRPEMMLAWDDGHVPRDDRHGAWQALLWQELARRRTGRHRAELWRELLGRLAQTPSLPPGLPRRVSVFGISYLPPFYLQALAALSRVLSVDLYQLNPCREYWADIVSREEGQRLLRPLRTASHDADLHLEEGNRLLASLGAQGRAFYRLVEDFNPTTAEHFAANPPGTLLAALQNDILNLRNGPVDTPRPLARAGEDRSLQVQACHSPMREIEILYDHLLDLLNRDSDLAPRDILVLTPDIDTYAPYIQAVFGAPEKDRLGLPFSIADRNPLQNRPVIQAFLQLTRLKQSRFQASEILALLDLPAVRMRFDLSEEDMRLIAEWVAATRIRWGADGEAKTRLGLPPSGENTWQSGLDRLLMGYAVPAENERLFKGILPAGGVEGTRVEALGHLARFVDQLAHWQARLSQRQRLEDWSACLMALIDAFFSAESREEGDLLLLRRQIADMRQSGAAAGLEEALGIDVVRTWLEGRLADARSGGGFISGGITFAALLPMRSIPAKLVGLVGMNQDLFPREDRPPSFDLMAAQPRIGDRSRRNDDKYLFLEALISARRYLYISYVGYDLQDNALLPPSVLVSEVLDYADERYGRSARDLVVRHRRQPFSPAYFTSEHPHLFSYSHQFHEAAASLAARQSMPPRPEPFLDGVLSEWEDTFQTVDLETLARAIGHPCRFLLEKRLQLHLGENVVETADREAFQLDPLDRYRLGQEVIEMLLEGGAGREALAKARAAGRLPHGQAGELHFEAIYAEAEEMAALVRTLRSDTLAGNLAVQVRIPPYTLSGRLTSLFPAGQVLYRYARARGPDLLAAWVRHLVWCRHEGACGGRPTTLVTRDGLRRIDGVRQPDAHLKQLLTLYEQAGHAPVPLFPRSSWEYAVLRIEKGYAADRALERVRTAWVSSFGWPGESSDPYIQHCYRDTDPLGEAFAATAEAVYGPILQHTEKV